MADFFSVVFTVVLVTVSFLAVSAPIIFQVSFLAVSGFTVESTFVVVVESVFDESALLAELLPLHAANDNDNASATNGNLT